MVRNQADGTTFMALVQFLSSKRLYSSGKSMTSTSTTMVFPPRVIGRAVKISYGENDLSSNVVRMVGDGVMGGESRAFQQDIDITKVVTPSSITI